MSESESKSKVRMARMASGSDAERHKAFLSTTTVGELAIREKGSAPRADEPWKIKNEWSAIPNLSGFELLGIFSGHGYKEEHFLPRFVTWHPDGKHVYTSPDYISLARWDAEGHAETQVSARRVGLIRRTYWSPRGEWILCLAEVSGRYGSNVYSKYAERCGRFDNFFGRFGMTGRDHGPPPAFNPWRPFAKGFVNLPAYSQHFDLRMPFTNEAGDELAVGETVDLSELNLDDRNVISYLWHPSGRYLAFASNIENENTRNSVTRIHLMDWDTARIVVSTPPFVSRSNHDLRPLCCAWSPDGQWLVLDDSVGHIWDIQSGDVSPLPTEAESRAWVRRLRAFKDSSDDYGVADSLTSPDGQRRLRVTNDGFTVGSESGEVCFELSARHAAWHPTDPLCFATVGGKRFERTARIWHLDPADLSTKQ